MRAWRANLPPDDIAMLDQMRQHAKRRAESRRAAKRSRDNALERLDQSILQLVHLGLMTNEIAAKLLMTERGVRRRCQHIGVDLATPKRRRLPSVWVGAAERDRLAEIAQARDESIAATLAFLNTVLLEDGAYHARRLLRVRAPAVQLMAVA